MQRAGIMLALTMYWLAGVVGASSLLPDDQYSPQQSPYRQDAARGPRGYPNWLEYRQDPNTESEPPEDKPGLTSPTASDSSGEQKARKDSVIPDLKFLSQSPSGWDVINARAIRNFTALTHPDADVPEEGLDISSTSREDPYESDDAFQDQGPGSVEVYKLDLRRENSLLVSQAKRKQPTVSSRIKSKIPKKAKADEILWKLKPSEPVKTLLPAIFRQPPSIYRGKTIRPESMDKIKENRKDEVSSVGGVPELQVGCEGLEALDRKRRLSEAGDENTDEEWWPKFKDPVYRESTEPILLRVTPIVLDFEDEPPAGQIYEELDELLKLKSTTTPEPTTKRTNRGDIDPALENYQHRLTTTDEKLPERGDLGPNDGKDSSTGKGSIPQEDSQRSETEGMRFPREAHGEEFPSSPRVGDKNDATLSPTIGSLSENVNHRGRRKLLWVQYPESQDSQPRTRHHQDVNDHSRQDLRGFGEDDGEITGNDDQPDADDLRKLEEEKRRREYERRRQEDTERRRHGHRPDLQEHSSRVDGAQPENERIREEYEKQQEKEQEERRRLEERRNVVIRRLWEEHQRKMEEVKRRQSEESQRGVKKQEGNNRDPSQLRRMQEEERRREHHRREQEEERRIRLEEERADQPPSPLTRPSPHDRLDNRSRSHQEEERREIEEQRRRESMERTRPTEVRNSDDRRRPEYEASRRNEDEDRSRHIEAQRRRQMEEHRRWQQSRDEEERRRKMDDQRRRDRTDDDRASEDERRKRLEEERKLRDYVRRNQPIHVPRRNSSQATKDWQEQRRIIEEARRWEHKRQQIPRPTDGRSHGPSAPTNIGQRQSQEDPEGLRRRQERERLERMRFQEEGRRREEEYRRAESKRREEERQRLEAARRMEESNRRRPSWEDSHRPANTSHGSSGTRDRDPGELRRVSDSSRRNQDDEWRRRSEERERQRQRQLHEERERLRSEHAANARNNGRRRPQHANTRPNEQRQRGATAETQNDMEWRRREEARLKALPVSARIVIRSDERHSRDGGNSETATLVPPTITLGPRAGFGNEIDFPALNPHRPGLEAARFPAPGTERPPSKSPSACVWAIVNCCPANDRLGTCFESMGCPGVNWDPSPCRAAVQSAARAQVLSFYETAESN